MRRRTLIVGGASLAAVAATGVGVSQTDMLAGEPTDATATTAQPGVFEYGVAGVASAAWVPVDEETAALRVEFDAESPPDAFRLHRPDGKRVWASSDITEGRVTKDFGLPIMHHGEWELVSQQAGSYTSLQLPVRPSFTIQNYGVRGDTLVADIVNGSNAPNYIDYIRVSPDARGYGKEYDIEAAVMPGQLFRLEEPYPLDFYKDVELSVWSDNELPGTSQKKTFA